MNVNDTEDKSNNNDNETGIQEITLGERGEISQYIQTSMKILF